MFSSTSSYHIEAAALIETPAQIYNKILARDDCRYTFEFGSTRTCTMDKVYVHTSSGKSHLSSTAQSRVKLES